jgi:hypothetical protein
LKHYKEHFPAEFSTFTCYTQSVDMAIIDAIQKIPDKRIYHVGFLISVFGIILSIGFVALVKKHESKRKITFKDSYRKLMEEIDSNDFLTKYQYNDLINYIQSNQEAFNEKENLSKPKDTSAQTNDNEEIIHHFHLRRHFGRISGFKKINSK